jgi:hypothetical protein
VRAHDQPFARDGKQGPIGQGNVEVNVEKLRRGRIGHEKARGRGNVKRLGRDPNRQKAGERDASSQKLEEHPHTGRVTHHTCQKRHEGDGREDAYSKDCARRGPEVDRPESPRKQQPAARDDDARRHRSNDRALLKHLSILSGLHGNPATYARDIGEIDRRDTLGARGRECA